MKNFSEYLEESFDTKIIKALKLPRTKEFTRKTTDDIENVLVSHFNVRKEDLSLYKPMRAPQYEWSAPKFTKFPFADIAEDTGVICIVEYFNEVKDVSVMLVRKNGAIASWSASAVGSKSNPRFIKNILKVYYLPAKAVAKAVKTGGSADIMKKIENAEYKNALLGAFLRRAVKKYPSLSFEAVINEVLHWLSNEDEHGRDIAFEMGLEFKDRDRKDAIRVADELLNGSTKRFTR